MKGTSLILDLTRSGRITPSDGAALLEMRRLLAWRQLPWWERLLIVLLGGQP
jgi:hypothetical protein